MILFGIADNI